MKKYVFGITTTLLILTLAFMNIAYASQNPSNNNSIKPIVSCDWLEKHLESDSLVIIDVRSPEAYAAGHIKGSINSLFDSFTPCPWITTSDDGLLLELPATNDLLNTIGSLGIKKSSRVVIVSAIGNPPFEQAAATRVADTLIYAGIKNVLILNGGYPKWVEEGKEVTTEVPTVTPVNYNSTVAANMFVDKSYVKSKIGKSIIIDGRDAASYLGEQDEPWTPEFYGHIESAVSLPAPLIWNDDGTYKSKSEIKAIVQNVIGKGPKNQEIIVYCGVGGYASSLWYVMTQILDYNNVKFYDGSAQEWVQYNELVK